MLKAFSRYGARVVPDTEQIIAGCRARGELVTGPAIGQFESAFARWCGGGTAITASYGRMAFYYILRALRLPPGAEIVCPALTFWVIPEIVRVAGFTPVFADVDPGTFCMDPVSLERVITERTRAIVPTHLYGLPCEMDAIMSLADRHGFKVIEDCAHALGATYRGRHVGTFGDAGFFSFQLLKPLNTYGGGMTLTADPALAADVRAQAEAEAWPDERAVDRKLLLGKAQRVLIRPRVFTIGLFPILWAASWIRARPDVYLWEAIRPLDPLPCDYRTRYTNVQAAIGLAGLEHLARWTASSRMHARRLDAAIGGTPGVQLPARPADREHAYYQYCFYARDRDESVRRAIRRGVDIETLHVDVCTDLELFGARRRASGADRAAEALQLPVYATLGGDDVEVLSERLARALTPMAPPRDDGTEDEA